jgi:hypothetical protein
MSNLLNKLSRHVRQIGGTELLPLPLKIEGGEDNVNVNSNTTNINLFDELAKRIVSTYQKRPTFDRELLFLSTYYGLSCRALTLEGIGKSQEKALTRERVRQIIYSAFKEVEKLGDNIYLKAEEIFKQAIINHKNEENEPTLFLRFDEVVLIPEFKSFEKNEKGLIAFLNDCNVKQISYRKKYYFYYHSTDRKLVTQKIQEKNKEIRHIKTLEKMNQKSKTVTYAPQVVRNYLIDVAKNKNLNLNHLYENIMNDFMNKKPYSHEEYVFNKTKSWRARKGKAQWEQIGIYIDKNIFENIKDEVKNIKKGKNVSLMNFICQSFIWYYESHTKRKVHN